MCVCVRPTVSAKYCRVLEHNYMKPKKRVAKKAQAAGSYHGIALVYDRQPPTRLPTVYCILVGCMMYLRVVTVISPIVGLFVFVTVVVFYFAYSHFNPPSALEHKSSTLFPPVCARRVLRGLGLVVLCMCNMYRLCKVVRQDSLAETTQQWCRGRTTRPSCGCKDQYLYFGR